MGGVRPVETTLPVEQLWSMWKRSRRAFDQDAVLDVGDKYGRTRSAESLRAGLELEFGIRRKG